ncbi:uncharacterized protein L201_001704 [Kwoniella dendrophila CBS 6074]|uniref:Uncharacterized protein n=1 Tax=Kwoniella dendrophila CBS 6074 TaxID=1295534 RepID=A0AAX4JQL9_9TREE
MSSSQEHSHAYSTDGSFQLISSGSTSTGNKSGSYCSRPNTGSFHLPTGSQRDFVRPDQPASSLKPYSNPNTGSLHLPTGARRDLTRRDDQPQVNQSGSLLTGSEYYAKQQATSTGITKVTDVKVSKGPNDIDLPKHIVNRSTTSLFATDSKNIDTNNGGFDW